MMHGGRVCRRRRLSVACAAGSPWMLRSCTVAATLRTQAQNKGTSLTRSLHILLAIYTLTLPQR